MAEGGQKRDPKTHRTPAQEKRHIKGYQASPKQKENRAKRNSARRTMEKSGKVKKGDNKHVDHKKPLSKGGSNGKGNLRVTSARANQRKANK
jgi:hypothetical protein